MPYRKAALAFVIVAFVSSVVGFGVIRDADPVAETLFYGSLLLAAIALLLDLIRQSEARG